MVIQITYASIGIHQYLPDPSCEVGVNMSGDAAFTAMCVMMMISACLLPCLALEESVKDNKNASSAGFLTGGCATAALVLAIYMLCLQEKHPNWCVKNKDIIRQTCWVEIILMSVVLGLSVIACMVCTGTFCCIVCSRREEERPNDHVL